MTTRRFPRPAPRPRRARRRSRRGPVAGRPATGRAPRRPDAAARGDPWVAVLRGPRRPRPPRALPSGVPAAVADVVDGRGPGPASTGRIRTDLLDDVAVARVLRWPDCGLDSAATAGCGVVRATAAVASTGSIVVDSAATAGWSACCPRVAVFVCPRPTVPRHRRRPPPPGRAVAGRPAHERRVRHRAIALGRHRDAPRRRRARPGRGPRRPRRPMSALFADPYQQDFANLASRRSPSCGRRGQGRHRRRATTPGDDESYYSAWVAAPDAIVAGAGSLSRGRGRPPAATVDYSVAWHPLLGPTSNDHLTEAFVARRTRSPKRPPASTPRSKPCHPPPGPRHARTSCLPPATPPEPAARS